MGRIDKISMDSQAEMLTIGSHYVRAVLRAVEARGDDVVELLAEQGISVDVYHEEQGFVHVSQFIGLAKRVWELLDDEFWGLSGSHCKIGLFGLMVRYVNQFDSLGIVLKEVCHFYNTTRDDVAFRVETEGEQCGFYIELVRPDHDSDHYLIEFLLVTIHRLACWITGKRILLDSASFSYSAPQHIEGYKALFPCERNFEQSKNAFFFNTRYLNLPLVRSNADLKEYLKNAPADLLVTPGTDDSYGTKIKSILLDKQRQGEEFPEAVGIAEQLFVSPQTLRRKLQAENTSYQQIKNLIRRDLAIDKLINENVSVADIGQQLGFLEPASFTRAFKQWTGVSPSDYRLGVRNN